MPPKVFVALKNDREGNLYIEAAPDLKTIVFW